MVMGTGLKKADLEDTVLLCFALHEGATMSAADCKRLLSELGIHMSQERADEFMSALAQEKRIRQVGPGVFAKMKESRVSLEQPLWPEDARK